MDVKKIKRNSKDNLCTCLNQEVSYWDRKALKQHAGAEDSPEHRAVC